MGVELGPRPPLLPAAQPSAEGAARPPAKGATARPAPQPAVVIQRGAIPRGPPAPAAPGTAAAPTTTAAAVATGEGAPAPLQQAHLRVQVAARSVARAARAAPGAAAAAATEVAAAQVHQAARTLGDAVRALAPRGEEDRQALAVLRTFLGQALDAEGARPELLLPATLREVRLHLERLLSRLGLPALSPDDPRLHRLPSGEWVWAPEPAPGEALLPRLGKAAALLLAAAAGVALWLALRGA